MKEARPERYYPWLAVAAFLAPLLGGQLSLDPLPLAPGGLLSALFSEPQGASLAHALIFLPVTVGLLIALIRRSVIQLPHARVIGIWCLCGVLLLASVAMSAYKFTTIQVILEWWAYLGAFFTAIILVGRGSGTRYVVGALAASTSLVAVLAIREYAVTPDPTWRVIANWLNPNALAALLIVGIFANLGMYLSEGKTRLPSVLPCLGASLCTISLALTGSKGGLIALAIAFVGFFLVLVSGDRKSLARGLGIAALVLVAGAVLANLLVMGHRKPEGALASGGAFARVAGSGSTQEQSSGFRKLLWQSSIALIKDNPIGRGMGTYRYHSAKPGLTTQTHLAHQSYLQLGVEGGVATLGVFVVGLILSLFEVLRGSRKLPTSTLMLRAGAVGALFGLAAHSMVDSDFSHFGLGFIFFLLLGILFQLSNDATVPEFTPRPLRSVAGGIALLTTVGLFFFGLVDVKLGSLRHMIGVGEAALAIGEFESLKGLAPADARVWWLGSRLAPSVEERIKRLQRAAELGPTPLILRQLSSDLKQSGDIVGAERELRASLALDPNNLFSLHQLLELAKEQDAEKARSIATKLVGIESTPYFKIRSIPELVPTETFRARAYLAESLVGTEQAEMLKPAVQGYLQYARMTVPSVKMFAKNGLDGGYGNITLAEARETLAEALRLCDLIAKSDSGWTNQPKAELTSILEGLN